MSSGVLVIVFVAALVVVAPSTVAIVSAWRRGGVARVSSVVAMIVIFCLAGLFLTPSSWPNSFEERIVLFLAAWGMLLALTGVPLVLFTLGKRIYQQRRSENQ